MAWRSSAEAQGKGVTSLQHLRSLKNWVLTTSAWAVSGVGRARDNLLEHMPCVLHIRIDAQNR